MQNSSICYFILTIVLVSGCSLDKRMKDDLAFVDINKNYPEKEIF